MYISVCCGLVAHHASLVALHLPLHLTTHGWMAAGGGIGSSKGKGLGRAGRSPDAPGENTTYLTTRYVMYLIQE